MKLWLRSVSLLLLLAGLANSFYGCGDTPSDGGEDYTKLELMLLAANDYIDGFTYISGWYNRENKDDTIGTHYNSSGVAYSYYSTDPPGYFEAKIDSSDDCVTRWCDYSPYRPAAGSWDVNDGYWTGTYCNALVYNCCAYAGYSFTSDSMYLKNVNEWNDPNIGNISTDSSQVQVGDIMFMDFSGNGEPDHVGIISDVSEPYPQTKMIQAIGYYDEPLYFKAVECKIKNLGEIIAASGYPLKGRKFLHLYDQ
jgi:hypothetical protein